MGWSWASLRVARLMQVASVNKSRHVPAVADGEQAESQSHSHGDDHHWVVRKTRSKTANIEDARDDRDASIQLAAKQQRYVVAQHVAQHPADAAGDHARHDDDEKRQ